MLYTYLSYNFRSLVDKSIPVPSVQAIMNRWWNQSWTRLINQENARAWADHSLPKTILIFCLVFPPTSSYNHLRKSSSIGMTIRFLKTISFGKCRRPNNSVNSVLLNWKDSLHSESVEIYISAIVVRRKCLFR